MRLRLSAAVVLCSGLCAGAAPGADTRLDPKAPQAAIGGRIQFPGNGIAPAMRVCALSEGNARCIDSPAGRTLYRIEHLLPGSYRVVARVQSPEWPVAGHVGSEDCGPPPCAKSLVTLALAEGQEIATADLNGFYAARADFPALPAD